MAPYEYVAHGRSPRTAAGLAAAWAVLAGLWLILNASPWILALLALATVPALRDLWLNPSAGMTLDDTRLAWHSGRRRAELPLEEIEKVRLDRSWDFAIRAAVVLHGGRKIRMPAESVPPHDTLEAELAARSVTVERHPFSIF